jgi:hypothetical protein
VELNNTGDCEYMMEVMIKEGKNLCSKTMLQFVNYIMKIPNVTVDQLHVRNSSRVVEMFLKQGTVSNHKELSAENKAAHWVVKIRYDLNTEEETLEEESEAEDIFGGDETFFANITPPYISISNGKSPITGITDSTIALIYPKSRDHERSLDSLLTFLDAASIYISSLHLQDFGNAGPYYPKGSKNLDEQLSNLNFLI